MVGAEKPYSFAFDKAKNAWICSVHGDVSDCTAWVPCWMACDEGYVDEYEDDPINNAPGDMSLCSECHGEGGWIVCGECNAHNPDVEF